MNIMTAAEAARAMGGTCSGEASFSEVCIDTRSITPGCLYIAIKGDRFDGHDFVAKAFEAGAAAAVCSRDVEADGTIIRVEDTRKALIDLAAYNRSKYQIPVVGLTGSVGKTTTKDMVAYVLGQRYRTLATEGNFNNEIGLPRMCLRLDDSIEAAVFEMGMSNFGEISRLTTTAKPTIGLITNIGVSHIEMLGSREGILKAKMEILDGMDKDSKLVLNGDDDMLRTVIAKNPWRVVSYGIEREDVDFRATDIKQGEDSITFTLSGRKKSWEIKIPVIGIHNVYNACAAFICGAIAGVPASDAIEGLANYVPDARRQKIEDRSGVKLISDCYNASPDSIRASLSVLYQVPCSGRKIAVLGDMFELGDYAETAHRQCGEAVAEKGVDMLFAVGKNAAYYIEGANGKVTSKYFEDKESLADALKNELREGDAVLFKASRGMKLEEVIDKVFSQQD